MENNISININGKKIELTDEQIEQLCEAGIVKRNPFARAKQGKVQYSISYCGKVEASFDNDTYGNNAAFDVANYCTDKAIMEQRALHETLNRLLWRFSMENGGDEIDWSNTSIPKWSIYYNASLGTFFPEWITRNQRVSEVYFKNGNIAYRAIDEIITPFLQQHPECEW